MWSNAYDDATDFEVHGFIKNRKMWISWIFNIIFSPNKKIHSLRVIIWQKIVF